jgi:hypothetical protein
VTLAECAGDDAIESKSLGGGTVKLKPLLPIFFLSAIGFYVELWNVRFVGTVVGELAYYSNLLLLSGILGFCAGLLMKPRPRSALFRGFVEVGVALLALHAAAIFFARGDLTSQESAEFFWFRVANVYPKGNLRDLTLSGFALCVLITLSLIPIGRMIAAEFEALKERQIQAYLGNVLGGILGSVIFGAILWVYGAPLALWGGLAALIVALVLSFGGGLFGERASVTVPMAIAAALIFVGVAVQCGVYGSKYMWSPYYRVSLVPNEVQLRSRPSFVSGYNIQSNHFFISGFNTVSFKEMEEIAKAIPEHEVADRTTMNAMLLEQGDFLPFHVARTAGVKKALMLGTCAGNELGHFLEFTPMLEEVTAVEIDPLFVKLGKGYRGYREARRAYDNPKVKLVVGDARQFLQSTNEKYDMIYFAFLDSQTTATNLSRFRLDSFVFTVEAMERMLDRLNPGGILAISFTSAEEWIVARFYENLRAANGGIPPRVMNRLSSESTPGNPKLSPGFIYFATPNFHFPPSALQLGGYEDATAWAEAKTEIHGVMPSYDNWPFLYLKSPQIPTEYAKFMLIFALFGIVVVLLCGGRGAMQGVGVPEWMFALLGFGFFVLEIRTISVSAVAWGVTLYSQAGAMVLFTFCSFLGSALFLKKPHWNVHIFWALLVVSLLGNFVFGVELMAQLSGPVQKLSTFLLAVPMIFSGFLFARYFSQAASPQSALAWNVIGGILGGLAESLSLLIGFRMLVLVALGAYLLAYLLSFGWSGRKASVRTAETAALTPTSEPSY